MLNKISKSNIQKSISLANSQTQGFAGINFKRKPTKKDLPHYEVVIVGANLGGIFSRHFDHATHGHHSTMAVFDQPLNQQYPMRVVYEQQRASKTDYLINAKLAINMYAATESSTVESFQPDENTVTLKTGRKIQYDWLVLAMGLKEDFDAVKGLEDAWNDVDHPVFTNKDSLAWKSNVHKEPKFHYSFNSGDAYFCIPPYPFQGEVESYSFFLTRQIYNWYLSHGKLSPVHSFKIINANDRFVQHSDSVEKYIREQLVARGIPVEFGLKLSEIDKKTQTMTLVDVKTGEKQQRPYSNLYSLIPTKPHENLVKAGLANKESNFLLDVDQHTLKHKKYDNIFGIGDVNNLPTSKNFWGGFHQVSVVRHNLERAIAGKNLNALYDGYNKVPLFLGQNQLTYMVHYYNGRDASTNLLGSTPSGSLIAWLRYLYWGKQQKKKFLSYYLFKTWGPPYYRFKRRFFELNEAQKAEQQQKLLEYDAKYWPNHNKPQRKSSHGHGHAHAH